MPPRKKKNAESTGLPVIIRPAGLDIKELPEFKKAVQAIYIASPTGAMGLLHRKAGNTLILNAMEQARKGVSDNTFTIPYKTFCYHIGYDSNDSAAIKAVLKSLRDHEIEWNLLDDKSNEVWGISSMLAEAILQNGIIEYSFPPRAGKLLMNPEIYARLDPSMQRRFTRASALILYEACARYRDVKRTGNLPVEKWKEILGATGDAYQEFMRFRSKVLNPALEQVNKVSDLSLVMELTTHGRKVTHIQFLIEDKKQTTLALEGTVSLNDDLYNRILKLGVKPEDAKGVLLQHPDDYVLGNLEVVESKLLSNKPPRNPASYFLSAIQRDYRPTAQAPKKKPSKKIEGSKSNATDVVSALHEAFAKHRAARTQELLAGMSSFDREEMVGKYIQTVTSPDLKKKYEKGGLEVSPILKNGFLVWASNILLTDPLDRDLFAWAAENGFLQLNT